MITLFSLPSQPVPRLTVWTDAHLSPALAPWLTANFHVAAVPLRELGLRDSEDAEIFAAARSAGAVIITKDSDFVDLVGRLGPPPQIVWLTCGNTSNAALRAVFEKAWTRVADHLENGEPIVEITGAGT